MNFLQNLNTNNIEETDSIQLEINTDCNSEVENIIVENLESLENFENSDNEEEENEENEENEDEKIELNIENVEE
jgi:hypothetical protein